MGQGTQRIRISLAKPLQKLLSQQDHQDRLEKRIEELERRLNRLERRRHGMSAAPTVEQESLETGIFFTDADEAPPLKPQQQTSYEAWQEYFSLHPDEIEPGRTAHEMAALRAATQSPIRSGTIDQQP